jgi:hypothetical protein
MRRLILSSLVVAAAVVLAASAGARPAMTHPKLIGAVGKNDAFTITLRTASGKLVQTLPAGTYTFVIHDFSSLHNFMLNGPHGLSHTFTGISAITTKTATLRLAAGKYKYLCAAHPTTMFHFFTVK